ncbi:hypothetical protein Tco_0798441 [Tanacetum coccineum]
MHPTKNQEGTSRDLTQGHSIVRTAVLSSGNKNSKHDEDRDGDASFPVESRDSLPHCMLKLQVHTIRIKDLRIEKAQVLKTKTSANSDIQDLSLRYQVYQWRLLARFQDGPKCEHIYIYTISLKLLSMAALYRLDKLAEGANSSRMQDKIKVVFIHARGADESFIALMRNLCSALRVSIAKNQRLIAELETLGQQA